MMKLEGRTSATGSVQAAILPQCAQQHARSPQLHTPSHVLETRCISVPRSNVVENTTQCCRIHTCDLWSLGSSLQVVPSAAL